MNPRSNKGKEDTIILYGTGDLCIKRDNPESTFALVKSTLSKGDINFCQLETMFSDRGTPMPQALVPERSSPDNAIALKSARFDVVSLAGNHCMDYGADALFDTMDILKKNGHLTVGAGKNIAEARKPALINRKGTRVAFLSYNSILPVGYWATDKRPGCAPLRVYTVYEQVELSQPGTPARIRTFPRPEDLEDMLKDIAKAKAKADIVVLSIHWGLHFIPAELAEYQRVIAHTAIDAGVDLILGHHAHILKPVEVYKGKVIFYSLCNFAFDSDFDAGEEYRMRLNPRWVIDPQYANYCFPPDSRKTILVKCIISDKHIQRVSFLPIYIKPTVQPEILSRSDKRFDDVVKYMRQITASQGLGTKYSIDGNEVVPSEA